jgi:hypothetical protein
VPNALIDSAATQLWIITHRSMTRGHVRKRRPVKVGDIGRGFGADETDNLPTLPMTNFADGVPPKIKKGDPKRDASCRTRPV